jgi:peptidoglycan hydrolase CwlO-like protein
MPRKMGVALLTILTAAFMFGGLTAQAQEDSIAEKQAEISDVHERVVQLRAEASFAQEDYNSALVRLERLEEEIAATDERLASAEERYAEAQARFSQRAAQAYTSGNVAFVDVLLGAENFSEFAVRLQVMMQLLNEDRKRAESVRETRDELQQARATLESQRAQRAAAVEDSEERQERAERLAAQAEEYLAGLDGELQEMVRAQQEEQARQVQLAAQQAMLELPEEDDTVFVDRSAAQQGPNAGELALAEQNIRAELERRQAAAAEAAAYQEELERAAANAAAELERLEREAAEAAAAEQAELERAAANAAAELERLQAEEAAAEAERLEAERLAAEQQRLQEEAEQQATFEEQAAEEEEQVVAAAQYEPPQTAAGEQYIPEEAAYQEPEQNIPPAASTTPETQTPAQSTGGSGGGNTGSTAGSGGGTASGGGTGGGGGTSYDTANNPWGVQPHVAEVGYAVRDRFGLSDSQIGGLRPGDPGDHGTGHALDFMTGGHCSALGWDIANYVAANADAFGVTYIMFCDKFYSTFTNHNGPAYTWVHWGDGAHYDHVHVSFTGGQY